VASFLFYLVIFDFSRGALDKYLMVFIVPCSIFCGYVFYQAYAQMRLFSKRKILLPLSIGILVAAVLLAENFIGHDIVALYPKSEWFSRALHGHWLMLTPLTGGSGPAGFYVSFLFIVVSFILSIVAVLAGLFKKSIRPAMLIVVACVGAAYNIVFTEEYFYGGINGSVGKVLSQNINYLKHHAEVSEVITYNDIGAGKLSDLGVYAGRFYAAPQYEEGHRSKFTNFTGAYMIVDIPHLYESGLYGRYFSQCKPLFETTSKAIKGSVLTCIGVPVPE
jgi:hypothetical protein